MRESLQIPDAAAEIAAKLHKWGIELTKTIFKDLIEMMYWDERRFDLDGMNAMLRGLRNVGQLQGNVDWGELIDKRILTGRLRM